MPVKNDLPNQKFKRGQRVKAKSRKMHIYQVGQVLPEINLSKKGFEAIIDYSCAQKYGGDNIDKYALIILENNKPINSKAWFHDTQLILINEDCAAGLEIIKNYYDVLSPARSIASFECLINSYLQKILKQ